MTPTLPAIVAASGLSLRMSTSKPLMEAGGRSFLAHILGTLRKGGALPILVVVRDLDSPESEETRAQGGVPVLNPDPTPGPISSLQAGIRALPEEAQGTLFCPADHPLFAAKTVQDLIRAFLASEAPLVAPAFNDKRGHPVIFGRELFPELLQRELPEGARTVVGRYYERRIVVPVQDPGILADIDTPEDYRRHFP